MRFTSNGFDLFRIMRLNSQRLIRVVTMPLLDGYRRIRRYVNPNGISTKVIGDLRKSFRQAISAKPSSLKDYVAFPRYYVAKSLLFIIVLLLIVLPILYLKFLHPLVQAKYFTTTMYVNAQEMNGYNGRVKLLSPSTNQVLYQGPLVSGRVSGQGLLWNQEGNLVYQGGFLMEMYDGEGELFYPDGQTQYKGAFVKNKFEGLGYYYFPEEHLLQYEGGFKNGLFEGQGKKYYDNGVLQYEGDFAKNNYHGDGVLYDPYGVLLYRGAFKDGKQDGPGVVYENGAIFYEGQFTGGRLNGAGKLYSGTMVLYDGSFKDNNYAGAGKAYDPVTENLIYDGAFAAGQYNGPGRLFDPQSGNLLYEGEFYDGAYAGTGKLYDPDTGFLLYDGGFRQGRFDGQGTQYDQESGLKLYEGGFLLGNYSGPGTIYDPLTGEILIEGIFRNGQLITPAAPNLPPWDAEGGASPGEGEGEGEGAEPVAPPEPPAPGPNLAEETGAVYYSGPKNENGVDFLALAKLTAAEAKKLFSQAGLGWDLETGSSVVYEDVSEQLGLTLQLNSAGELIGVDVWNDNLVENIRVGMSKDEILAILGDPVAIEDGPMGENRMVSVSQSNRYHNRITNISADSTVTLWSYNLTGGGTLRAVFLGGGDTCLLIEIRN